MGAKTSPTVAATPGASPTGGATPLATQGSSTNQGPGDSPTPANTAGDSSNSESNPLADALPLILVGLGVVVLLPLLFIPARILLRKGLVPLPSSKLPPSGAAPWSRSVADAQEQSDQIFLYTQPYSDPFYTPGSNDDPFSGNFTQANASDDPWSNNGSQFVPQTPYTAQAAYAPDNPWSDEGPQIPYTAQIAYAPDNPWSDEGPQIPYTAQAAYAPDNPWSDEGPQLDLHPAAMPDMPAFSGNQAYPQPSQPFLAPPVVPTTNAYAGQAQNQQPFPTTPPLLPGVQVGRAGQPPEVPASPAAQGYSSGDTGQPGDAVNSVVRKRLKRDGLHISGEDAAFGGQISGNVSADMMVVGDPYLGTMFQQPGQKGQIVQQAPEEFDAR